MDDDTWRAWFEKNLLQERKGIAARAKVVKWSCIGVLLMAAAVSSNVLRPIFPLTRLWSDLLSLSAQSPVVVQSELILMPW